MECFSVDESGYTGFDLLNAEQRFQGAAAIAITHEEASRLIEQHFPNLVAPELKYGALARRPNNRERLLSLQRDVLAHHKCVTYVCNKRFLLILMFLDYAIEPYYYKRRINFYEDGQNYSLGSLLYYTGPTLFGKDAFEALLIAFQRSVKEKTPDTIMTLPPKNVSLAERLNFGQGERECRRQRGRGTRWSSRSRRFGWCAGARA